MGNVFIVITIVVEVTQIQRNALAQAAFEGKNVIVSDEKRGGRTDHWC